MSKQKFERAAPPDDGGSQGSYTKPEEMLFEQPQDTRSQELLGTEDSQQTHGNRDLLLFMLVTVLIAAVMFAVGMYKHSI